MTDTTSHSRQATKLHGNITSDGLHSYSYDADGNLVSVDGGSTASYYYDSMNQRVRIAPTRGTYEFVWDVFGRRVSNWSASSHALAESNAYTESSPIAVRSGGQRQYETQNWLGSERVRTTYNGGTAIAIAELPWGDGHTPSGDNGDQHDFAGMDRDLEDNTEQAQYRQYSTNLGRWQSPDPYTGSYDFGNPQSFDRYSYALNDPANLLDPSGLDSSQCAADFCVVAWTYSNCDVDPSSCGLFPGGAGLEGAGGTLALPTCNGPRTGNCINTPQVRVIRIAAGAPSKTVFTCASEAAGKVSMLADYKRWVLEGAVLVGSSRTRLVAMSLVEQQTSFKAWVAEKAEATVSSTTWGKASLRDRLRGSALHSANPSRALRLPLEQPT